MRVLTIVLVFVLGLAIAAPANADFLRGDTNGDARVDPIEDALFLLDWAFNEGDEPPCEDAADVDGNNLLFALVDSLSLLNWAFDDAAAPPAPGVEECGDDPDADTTLGCDTEPLDCPSDEPTYEEDGDVVLSVGSTTIDDDTVGSVTVSVNIDNSGSDIRAFQFGVCHDPEVLCLDDDAVQESIELDALDPMFVDRTLVEGSWGAAVILDIIADTVIEDGEAPDVFDVTYSITGTGTSDLAFCEHPISHSWPIRVYTVDGPLLPTVEDGSIEVVTYDEADDCTLPPSGGGGGSGGSDDDCIVDGGEGDYTFTVVDASGFVGDDVTVPIDLLIEGTCVAAWQYGVCFEEDDLTYVDGVRGSGLDDLTLTFFATRSEEPGNVAAGCLLDVIEGTVLEEDAAAYEVALIDFTIEEDFGESIVSICEPEFLFGTGELGVVQQGGVLQDPAYDDGTVFTSSGFVSIIPTLAFERGDVDGNGDIFAIVDAIFLLEYTFVNGDSPPCFDAADVDDDGTIFGLLDATYLLQWGFVNGEAPPAPFDECDADPTDDDLGCESQSGACE